MNKLKLYLMKAFIRLNERKKRIEGIELKYLLFTNKKSKRLIVVFSGWPLRGVSTYNYVKTLDKIKDNKLFILDDEGYKHLGTYYLGNSCKWLELDVIPKLINSIKNKYENIQEIVFAGTSKGATCSLLYGLRMNIDVIICGSPQYRIAWYLQHSGEKHLKTFPLLVNDSKYEEKDIDALLENAIEQSNGNTRINMIYSSGEFLYPSDCCYLVDKLNHSGLRCNLMDLINEGFTEHSDVGTYFKPFILKTLREI